MGLVTLFLRPPESVLVPVLAQYQFDGDGVTLGLVTFSLRPLESVLVPVLVQYQSGGDGVTLDLVTLSLRPLGSVSVPASTSPETTRHSTSVTTALSAHDKIVVYGHCTVTLPTRKSVPRSSRQSGHTKTS